jgi:hypothetical protein
MPQSEKKVSMEAMEKVNKANVEKMVQVILRKFIISYHCCNKLLQM